MDANGTASLVFIEDVTSDRISKMNSEVYKVTVYFLLGFSQMLQKTLDCASQYRLIMTQKIWAPEVIIDC